MTDSRSPRFLTRLAALLTISLLAAFASVPSTARAASTTTASTACNGVALRSSASTAGALRLRLAVGTRVTISGTVRGGSWRTECPGPVAGSTWYRVTAINGRSVSSILRVSAVYSASGLYRAASPSPTPSPSPSPTPSPSPSPSPSTSPSPSPAPAATTSPMTARCSGVAIRASASTSSVVRTRLASGTPVTVSGTVRGRSWSTVCAGASSGATWYRVTAINGRSVSSLFGVSAVYAATGVLRAVPAPSPTAAVTPVSGSITFYGRGWGHGVGLSQYGARGRALDGQDAATILAHYYPGTTRGPLAGDPQIRVLILNDFASTTSAPLVLYGRGGSWTVDGVAKTFPADARATVVRTVTTTPSGTQTTWQLKVTTAAGGTLYDAPAATDLRFRPGSSSTTIQLWSKPSVYDLYRGTLRVLLSSTADVIDEVSLEDYLRGVVPAEVPSSWPAAALAAQAIAARSYAAYRLRPGVSTFDMYDDTRSQVYQGVRKETAATNKAVSSTADTVLRSGTSVANALFSSTAGGATENNENVFVSPTGARVAGVVSYLRGSPDRRPDGTSYDDSSPYATWQTRAYTPAQLSAIFASDTRTSVGSLTALDLRNRGVSGRLISVTLIGSAGSKTVSGDVFIGVFNAARSSGDPMLRSTLLGLSPIP